MTKSYDINADGPPGSATLQPRLFFSFTTGKSAPLHIVAGVQRRSASGRFCFAACRDAPSQRSTRDGDVGPMERQVAQWKPTSPSPQQNSPARRTPSAAAIPRHDASLLCSPDRLAAHSPSGARARPPSPALSGRGDQRSHRHARTSPATPRPTPARSSSCHQPNHLTPTHGSLGARSRRVAEARTPISLPRALQPPGGSSTSSSRAPPPFPQLTRSAIRSR